MSLLGFRVTDASKKKDTIYIDGHERADVVAYRRSLVARFMDDYLRRMRSFAGEDMSIVNLPDLRSGEKELVWVTHDECIFHSNDDIRFVRMLDDEQPLIPKGSGRGIMVSEFLCCCHGRLVGSQMEARDIMKYGQGYDGYWNSECFIEAVERTIRIHCQILSRNNTSVHIWQQLESRVKGS